MMRALLERLTGRADLAMAAMMFAIVVVLVAPMAPAVLDLLIVASLLFSLAMLLMAARIASPLELLTFPALLLLSTLFRLALNVASTKMVLVDGQAGHVIETFGRLVVGGNLLAGVCVFVIVAIVQLLVVAKGSERAAEVAARFALDAMPGKQMAIDSDLRGGALAADEGRRQREQLDIESRLFGGMDGAMKFVKGDAIAGLVIATVNIFGGLASGMLYHGLPFGEAMHRYTVLSIGDALVSQIPSLLAALASGLIITRVASVRGATRSVASQIGEEFSRHRAILWQLAVVCALGAAVPGMPTLVLLATAATLAAAAAWTRSLDRRGGSRGGSYGGPSKTDESRLPSFARIGQDAAPFRLGDGDRFDAAITVSMPERGIAALAPEALDAAVAQARRRLAVAGQVAFPGMGLKPVASHDAESTVTVMVLVNGSPWSRFDWPLGHRLVAPRRGWWMKVPGLPPGFADARWVEAATEPDALGIEDVIAAVVEAACLRERETLTTSVIVDALIRDLAASHPRLTEQVMESATLPRMTSLLSRLVGEGVPPRALPIVLDRVMPMMGNDAASGINDLVESALVMLAELRCPEAMAAGALHVMMIGPTLDRLLVAVSRNEPGFTRVHRDAMRRQIQTALAEHGDVGDPLPIVCDPDSRSVLAGIAALIDPRLRVFAFTGLPLRLDIVEKCRIEVDADTSVDSPPAAWLPGVNPPTAPQSSNDDTDGEAFAWPGFDDPESHAPKRGASGTGPSGSFA